MLSADDSQTGGSCAASKGTGIVIAFTSISRGEGVSYVVDSLAWHLAQHTGDSILLTNFGGLAGAATAEFWEPQSIQRTDAPSSCDRSAHSSPRGRPYRISVPASDSCWWIARRCVNRPGYYRFPRYATAWCWWLPRAKAKPEEIGFAQKTLAAASSNLLGLVLNKRTNPIPRLFSKFV
jgi:hypothetical protein